MNNGVLDTLFYPFLSGVLDRDSNSRVLFLNAQNHSFLKEFSPKNLTLEQMFKPYANVLEHAGFAIHATLDDAAKDFDIAVMLAPKNQIESLYMLARALMAVKTGGMMVMAADNKAGGGRLVNNLKSFGLEHIQSDTRNKARVVWARVDGLDMAAIERALNEGAMQLVGDTGFQSQPGIYGWNKIDTGSRLLAQHLTDQLKGRGADFGCGYGYLSRFILDHHKPKSLALIDADARALAVSRLNCISDECDIVYEWADLTASELPVRMLDFIVMNPPFHEGKASNSDIGAAFIRSAAKSLRRNGRLWMVANNHLPYEPVLNDSFFKVEKIVEAQGFKVFCAVI